MSWRQQSREDCVNLPSVWLYWSQDARGFLSRFMWPADPDRALGDGQWVLGASGDVRGPTTPPKGRAGLFQKSMVLVEKKNPPTDSYRLLN